MRIATALAGIPYLACTATFDVFHLAVINESINYKAYGAWKSVMQFVLMHTMS